MIRKNHIRRTDLDRLNRWLTKRGAEGMTALLESGLSIHTIAKITQGSYQSSPRKLTRAALCTATGLSEDELFPIVSESGKAS
jgi:hypothetical protein